MHEPINCETAVLHREEYLRGDGPAERTAVIDAHLAGCASCLDAFMDTALATPMVVTPTWGLTTRIVANLPSTPATSSRRSVVIAVSALVGILIGAIPMVLSGDGRLLSSASTAQVVLHAAVVLECVAVLCFLSSRGGVLAD